MSFLFVDEITALSPGKRISGIKTITEADLYLSVDEENRRIFPSSLIGETLGQLAAWNVMQTNQFTQRPVAGIVASAKLHRAAFVGDCLRLESVIETLDERAVLYHSTAWVKDEKIVEVEGALGPLLPMEEFIDPLLIKAQFEALSSPSGKAVSRSSPLTEKPWNASKLMAFDTILEQNPETLVAEKWIDPEAPYFEDHFPRKPVLPMTILLESTVQLAKLFLASLPSINQYCIKELRRIKMNVFVPPGSKLICQASIKEKTENEIILAFRSEVKQKRVCVLEMVVSYE